MYELIIRTSPKHKNQWSALPVPEIYTTLFYVFLRMCRLKMKHKELKFRFEIKEIEYGYNK